MLRIEGRGWKMVVVVVGYRWRRPRRRKRWMLPSEDPLTGGDIGLFACVDSGLCVIIFVNQLDGVHWLLFM